MKFCRRCDIGYLYLFLRTVLMRHNEGGLAMFTRVRKGRLALVFAMLAVLCLGFTTFALAEDSTGDPASYYVNNAKLTKVIVAPKDTNTSVDSYTFHFAGAGTVEESGDDLVSDGVKQHTKTIKAGDTIPTIPNVTIQGRNVTADTALGSDATSAYQTTVSIDFIGDADNPGILDNVEFPHAGVYTYQVTEVQGTTNLQNDGFYINNSQASYTLEIKVRNDESSSSQYKTSVESVAIKQTKDDDGSEINEAKIDPSYPFTDDQGKITNQYTSDIPEGGLAGDQRGHDVYGFTFANEYVKSGELIVKKLVEGDYADKTKLFHITLKVIDPTALAETAAGCCITYQIAGGEDVTQSNLISGTTQHQQLNGVSGVTDYMVGFVGDTATIEANLHEGGTITITGLYGPYSTENYAVTGNYRAKVVEGGLKSGVSFEVYEDGFGDYMPTGYVQPSTDGVIDPRTATGDELAQLVQAGTTTSTDNGYTFAITGHNVSNNGTVVTVVNTLDDSNASATGIIINNLPYILMVGIPVAVFTAMFVAKLRENAAA